MTTPEDQNSPEVTFRSASKPAGMFSRLPSLPAALAALNPISSTPSEMSILANKMRACRLSSSPATSDASVVTKLAYDSDDNENGKREDKEVSISPSPMTAKDIERHMASPRRTPLADIQNSDGHKSAVHSAAKSLVFDGEGESTGSPEHDPVTLPKSSPLAKFHSSPSVSTPYASQPSPATDCIDTAAVDRVLSKKDKNPSKQDGEMNEMDSGSDDGAEDFHDALSEPSTPSSSSDLPVSNQFDAEITTETQGPQNTTPIPDIEAPIVQTSPMPSLPSSPSSQKSPNESSSRAPPHTDGCGSKDTSVAEIKSEYAETYLPMEQEPEEALEQHTELSRQVSILSSGAVGAAWREQVAAMNHLSLFLRESEIPASESGKFFTEHKEEISKALLVNTKAFRPSIVSSAYLLVECLVTSGHICVEDFGVELFVQALKASCGTSKTSISAARCAVAMSVACPGEVKQLLSLSQEVAHLRAAAIKLRDLDEEDTKISKLAESALILLEAMKEEGSEDMLGSSFAPVAPKTDTQASASISQDLSLDSNTDRISLSPGMDVHGAIGGELGIPDVDLSPPVECVKRGGGGAPTSETAVVPNGVDTQPSTASSRFGEFVKPGENKRIFEENTSDQDGDTVDTAESLRKAQLVDKSSNAQDEDSVETGKPSRKEETCGKTTIVNEKVTPETAGPLAEEESFKEEVLIKDESILESVGHVAKGQPLEESTSKDDVTGESKRSVATEELCKEGLVNSDESTAEAKETVSEKSQIEESAHKEEDIAEVQNLVDTDQPANANEVAPDNWTAEAADPVCLPLDPTGGRLFASKEVTGSKAQPLHVEHEACVVGGPSSPSSTPADSIEVAGESRRATLPHDESTDAVAKPSRMARVYTEEEVDDARRIAMRQALEEVALLQAAERKEAEQKLRRSETEKVELQTALNQYEVTISEMVARETSYATETVASLESEKSGLKAELLEVHEAFGKLKTRYESLKRNTSEVESREKRLIEQNRELKTSMVDLKTWSNDLRANTEKKLKTSFDSASKFRTMYLDKEVREAKAVQELEVASTELADREQALAEALAKLSKVDTQLNATKDSLTASAIQLKDSREELVTNSRERADLQAQLASKNLELETAKETAGKLSAAAEEREAAVAKAVQLEKENEKLKARAYDDLTKVKALEAELKEKATETDDLTQMCEELMVREEARRNMKSPKL